MKAKVWLLVSSFVFQSIISIGLHVGSYEIP
jgi:hypothetical protein